MSENRFIGTMKFLWRKICGFAKFICRMICNLLELFRRYFTIPLFFILLFSLFPLFYTNEIVNHSFRIVSGILIVIWILACIIVKKHIFKDGRFLFVFFVLALILSLGLTIINYAYAAKLYYCIGVIVFELYAISYIIFNIVKHSTPMLNTVFMCFQFIFFGYIAIFIGTYNYDDNVIFNSLISLLSSIIGGALTLGGVAWTIKYQKDEKAKESENYMREKKELIKPKFKFLQRSTGHPGSCYVEADENDFPYAVSSYIKSLCKYSFELKNLYIDGKKFQIKGNKLLATFNDEILLWFNIKDPASKIKLEVKDNQDQEHFYILRIKEDDDNIEAEYLIEEYEEVLV